MVIQLTDLVKKEDTDFLLQEKAIRALWAVCIRNRKWPEFILFLLKGLTMRRTSSDPSTSDEGQWYNTSIDSTPGGGRDAHSHPGGHFKSYRKSGKQQLYVLSHSLPLSPGTSSPCEYHQSKTRKRFECILVQ